MSNNSKIDEIKKQFEKEIKEAKKHIQELKNKGRNNKIKETKHVLHWNRSIA